MHVFGIGQLLFLLMLANGTPVIAKKILGVRYSYPVDCRLTFADGRPLLGRSKTFRGVVLAVAVTAAAAPLVGLAWDVGLLVGGFAMAGDVFSSFCKRRLNLPSSSRASGLDQVPESLFPALACRNLLGLTTADIVVCIVVFFVGEIVLSRVLYAFRLRDRPY
jgi:CDP-2,3-bis-(O-geranylgeranyl)-sn-glycerol synthase